MKYISICFIFFFLFLTGCSHSEYLSFNLDYSGINKDNEVKKMNEMIYFTEGRFSSEVMDGECLTTQSIGVHSYLFFPERPLDKVFYEALEQFFVQSGCVWAKDKNKGEIRIDVKFIKLNSVKDLIGYDAATSVIAQIDFLGMKKDTLIYSNIYYGMNFSVADIGFKLALNKYSGQLITVSTKREDILNRYGKRTDFSDVYSQYPKRPSFGLSANWEVFNYSVEHSIINLINQIGKDYKLTNALKNYILINKK